MSTTPLLAAPEAAKLLLKHGVKKVVFAQRTFANDGHWYANFGYTFDKKKLYGNKGQLGIYDVATGKITALIDDPKGAVRDPQVHYDAKKILFSYRKGGTAQYHLYEINVDGTGLKQLTAGIYDDIEPTYLPDGGIIFISARSKRWVNCWLVQVGTLFRCDKDGKDIQMLSANIEQDNTPWVLPDGRVLFTRWEYVDRSQVSFHHLWTCNPDGTNPQAYFGNMHRGGLFIDAKPIPGSDRVIYIHSPGHGRKEHQGHIATVSDKKGPDAKEEMRRVTKDYKFRDPYAITDKLFLTARDSRMYEIGVVVDGKYSLLFKSKIQLSEPRPLVKRERERIIPSRINRKKSTGTLVLNNAYIGRNMVGVKPGEIKKLLILETLPKPLNYGGGLHDFLPISHGGTFTLARILGTVPVEADGSAHFEVPANRPLFLISLNEKNESVKRMHSFLSVMPGESLSCIGCHETRTKTSEARSTVPRASKRPASRITPVPGVPFTIDFPRDVQPVLDKHCVKCHNSTNPKGKIILSGDRGPVYSHSYFTLTALGYISDGRNMLGNTKVRGVGDSASELMKMLDGSHHKAKLSPKEIEIIRNWIHIGAPYPGTYAALGTGMVRRGLSQDLERKVVNVHRNSCTKCHRRISRLAKYTIAGRKRRGALMDSHLVFNLTHPEKSLVLLAPLSKEAGGLGLCKAKGDKQKEAVKTLFKSKDDPNYKAYLALIKDGQRLIDENKRWNMPGFKPHPFYVREMIRYGILPETFDLEKDKIDVYEIDRKYFESLWYYPKGTGPKLYENKKFKQALMIDGRR